MAECIGEGECVERGGLRGGVQVQAFATVDSAFGLVCLPVLEL